MNVAELRRSSLYFKTDQWHLLKVLIIFVLFFPTFNSILGGGTKGAILLNGTTIILSSIVVLRGHQLPTRSVLTIALIMVIWSNLMAVSIAASEEIITRDLFEFHRPVLYGIVLLIPFSINWEEMSLEQIWNFMLKCFWVILVFAITQFLGLSDTLWGLYTKEHNVSSGRISGVFVNPYDYAYMMSLPFFYYFISFLSGKLKFGVYALIIFISVILTLSRTGLFILVIGICVSIVVLFVRRFIVKRKVKFKVFILSLFFLIFSSLVLIQYWEAIIVKVSYLYFGIVKLAEGTNNSFNTRIEQAQFVLGKTSPWTFFFGNGVSKAQIEFLEIQYVLYYFRYGLLGIILLLLLMFTGVYASFVLYLKSLNMRRGLIYLTWFTWFITTFVASMGNSFIDQIRNQFIYFFLIGLSAQLISKSNR